MKRYIQGLVLIGLIIGFSGCSSKFKSASWNSDITTMKNEFKNASHDDKGWAIYNAAKKGNLEIIKFLISKGVSPNHLVYAYSPLDMATRHGHFEIVKYMIKNGANVNIVAEYQITPIMGIISEYWKDNKFKYHYSNKTLQIAKYLLNNGARLSDLNIYDKAYYKEMTAAKNDFLRQYNQYLSKMEHKKQQLVIQREKKESIKQAKLKEIKDEQKVNQYVQNNNFQALKNLTDNNPNTVYYIKDNSIRLLLTGPKGMKVGDIKKYLQNGKSELIITSLINRVKEPYKEFTMKEIESLQ